MILDILAYIGCFAVVLPLAVYVVQAIVKVWQIWRDSRMATIGMAQALEALSLMNAYQYSPKMRTYYVPAAKLAVFQATYPGLRFVATQRVASEKFRFIEKERRSST